MSDFFNEMINQKHENTITFYSKEKIRWLKAALKKHLFAKYIKEKRSEIEFSLKRKFTGSELKNRLHMFNSGLQGVWGLPG